MDLKRLHKLLGWTLTIPLFAWGLTGIIFLIKPGYDGAYDKLTVRTYPMDRAFSVQPRADWHEAKLIKTILGYHLLLLTNDGSIHLDPISLQRRPPPTKAQVKQLVGESLADDPQRYGRIIATDTTTATTDTGVVITLNWNTLTLRQSGRDTRFFGTLYKIHYLQWWGNDIANVIFGAMGIAILLALVILGLKTSTGKPGEK